MQAITKTLTEMTLVERSTLLETVADALEATADEADEDGDSRFAKNSMCVAGTIRGLCGNLGERDLPVAEVLLEQGIMLVHQYSNRNRPTSVH